MKLKAYRSKRKFDETPEPPAVKGESGHALRFCVQKHAASHLHYDFRLELDGILLSWAVPKGPSMNPQDKRLAIKVEDHPVDYMYFEGVIPKGSYGAGTVMLWDKGDYTAFNTQSKSESIQKMREGLEKGHLEFELFGEKLKGRFSLIELKNSKDKNAWLLIKGKDSDASTKDITELDYSVKTHAKQKNKTSLQSTKSKPSAKSKQPELIAPLSAKLVDKPIKAKPKEVPLTNLSKIYWPQEKITKGDMIDYYREIAPVIVPYLKNHPLMMHRYPNGIEGTEFYQKDAGSVPDWVVTGAVKHKEKTDHYVLVQNTKTLLYVANLGSIELHPIISSIQSINCPDFIAIDLDPEKTPFKKLVNTALEIHEFLEEAKIPNYLKTSGASGLHLYIPLHAKYEFSQTETFAELLANIVKQKMPSIISLERSPKKRETKIYFDYLQNLHGGRSMVAPYSLRAREGATVSTPLLWKEVNERLDPKSYNIKTIPERLKKIGDVFKPVLGKGLDLKGALKRLEKLL